MTSAVAHFRKILRFTHKRLKLALGNLFIKKTSIVVFLKKMSAEIPSEFPGLIWIFVGNKNLGGSGEGSSQKSCTCALSLTSLFQTCAQTVRCIHGEINTSVI